jgi:predicted metal-dependent phosphoesterase TrpH
VSGVVDLHTHTTVSDGALEPETLVERALEEGLEVLAITDHDTVDGLAAARRAAPPGLVVLTGAELTCAVAGREAHILAYGVDSDDPDFARALERFRLQREERARGMVERLNAMGVGIEYAEIVAISGHGTVGRPHVAQALLARGVVGTLQEAFTRFLGRHAPAFVPKPALDPREAFDLVRAAGGVSSLAHPGTFQRDDLIPVLASAGLDALEVRHTEHSMAQIGHYERMARQLELLPTGGSDFHGTSGHRSRLGSPAVPRAWADALIARTGGDG